MIARRQLHERQLRFDDDAERAFAAHDPVDRILRGVKPDRVLLELGPLEIARPRFAVDEAHAAHVATRRAVAQRPRARRVARDRAADRRVVFARRIGREAQSERRELRVERADGDAGLDARDASLGIDVEHARHAGERQQNAAIGDRRAGRARLRAGRRHRRSFAERLATTSTTSSTDVQRATASGTSSSPDASREYAFLTSGSRESSMTPFSVIPSEARDLGHVRHMSQSPSLRSG